MTDQEAFPASEIAALYHKRWELELGTTRSKPEMLEREETIRCKSVAAVEQELWGISSRTTSSGSKSNELPAISTSNPFESVSQGPCA
jgi:hypothetical protein